MPNAEKSSFVTVPVVSFGPFTLDRRTQELRKHGIPLRVAPQAFRVLSALVDQAPEAVRRDELFQTLWPKDTHVDFEGNLNALIRDLREVLGDSARSPRYIQTEPKRGYRFIAPLAALNLPAPEPTEIKAEAVVGETPTAPPIQRSVFPRKWAAVLVLPFLAAAGFGYWSWQRHASPPRIKQLTSVEGNAGHPSFSPDGTRIAFHWNGHHETGFDIYVGSVGSSQFERLTSDPADDLNPSWSPDGRDIAFLRKSADGHCAIYLVPSSGGSERLIKEVPTESPLSWSPDGRWIVYSVVYAAASMASSNDFGVYAVSLLNGQVKRLSDAGPGWLGDRDGTFSPDGREVGYFRAFSTGSNELFLQQVNASMDRVGAARRLTFDGQNSRYPVWTPDGRRIVFSSLRGGVRSLWQVSASGPSTPELLGGEDAQEPEIDRSGERIVYTRLNISDVLRVLPLCVSGENCKVAAPRQLLYQRKLARNPSWSRDGQRIAFESYDDLGRVQVWICNADGANQTQVSSFESTVSGTPRWSPDNRNLVVDSRIKGHSKIFMLDTENRALRQITSGDWEDMTPSFSRDGEKIYFGSNRSGDFQVWQLNLKTGAVWQVTKRGGFYAMESVDGKKIYYAKGILRTEIGEAELTGGERTVISDLDYWPNFAVGSEGIYYVAAQAERGSVDLRMYRFSDQSHQKVAAVPAVNLQGMALDPSQRVLLLSVRASVETNLMELDLHQR